MPIPLLFNDDPVDAFPHVEDALVEPNGLLAAGGDLSVERLLAAYRRGIFPWYSEGEPILWWSPDPRCVLWPDDIHISRSLKKTLRNSPITVRTDTAFAAVVSRCAQFRPGSTGTWITRAMHDAYDALHREGHARSIECWIDEKLVGGLYGVVIDEVFFGESMFSAVRDASKIALAHLATNENYKLIDCQLPSHHLHSMGATVVSRHVFTEVLAELLPAR